MPADLPPVRRVRWSHAYRIVPSRFPPVGVYDRIADPADLDALFAIEALTNPRLREEAG
ncbi:MAG TPA: RES domain-containing protein, partial [Rhodanobacter sp.]